MHIDNKSALDRARELYNDDDFVTIIDHCERFGQIHCTKEMFICGYYAHYSLLTKKTNISLDRLDTFFICIASGRLLDAFDLIPKVKYIAWERFDGIIRIFDWDDFRRRCYGQWSNG